MGMFDEIRSSYDIGVLTNECCQTKDIEQSIDGTMSFYWVDPAGVLWRVDYSGTADFMENDDEDAPPWMQFKIIPSGRRGRVVQCTLSRSIVVYLSHTSPDGLLEWTNCELQFTDGVLQNYRYINNSIENCLPTHGSS